MGCGHLGAEVDCGLSASAGQVIWPYGQFLSQVSPMVFFVPGLRCDAGAFGAAGVFVSGILNHRPLGVLSTVSPPQEYFFANDVRSGRDGFCGVGIWIGLDALDAEVDRSF